MKIEFDSSLIEQGVFLAARRDAGREQALHTAIDPLYGLPPGQAREDAFRRTYGEFFIRFRLDRPLRELIDERPLIGTCVARGIVREAMRGKSEAAELLARPNDAVSCRSEYTLVIQVCPETLLTPERLFPRMRRELLHVHDMLDPSFQYTPAPLNRRDPVSNLRLDRYRILWDIYVEGRLQREGRAERCNRQRLTALLQRAFGCDEHTAQRACQRLFTADQLSHPQLWHWACEPAGLCSSDQPDFSPECDVKTLETACP
ncbi:MAG: hypothetical protein AMXMBFR13_49700 [Phycisphaerae bacterium]